ncbi:MAG: transcription termination/antitermination protein NusA, partial [Treponema sp.]|nr:transcription termination/antitermination protein NusA [Treponema sp.]
MSEMADAIRALSAEKGISEDSIRQTIENMIKAAYRKTYPAAGDNCVVEFADDMSDVTVYAMKTVVDGVYDPATEIELEEARKVADDAAVGDTMKVLVDPKNFVRASVSVGKQNAHQALNESFKDNLYNEYRDKVGQVIIGYYQRERNG